MSPSMERPTKPGSDESLWECREAIYEAAIFIGCYAGMAQGMAELGDDQGLGYTLRKSLAYMRFAIGAYNDLCAAQKPIEKSEAA